QAEPRTWLARARGSLEVSRSGACAVFQRDLCTTLVRSVAVPIAMPSLACGKAMQGNKAQPATSIAGTAWDKLPCAPGQQGSRFGVDEELRHRGRNAGMGNEYLGRCKAASRLAWRRSGAGRFKRICSAPRLAPT